MSAGLVASSIELIRTAQADSGAYPAACNYPTYEGFCWFRDASYVAHAMDRSGELESAARYHAWVTRTLLSERERIEVAVADPDHAGSRGAVLRARYPIDGSTTVDDGWPNFQLDGLGTWLWSRLDHARRGGRPLAGDDAEAAALAARYLGALWDQPNFDCWEEAGERRHPSTWGAIALGLHAYAKTSGDRNAMATTALIQGALASRGTHGGAFTKHEGSDAVDANLLWLGVPDAVFGLADPTFQRTLARIERELVADGLHRYRADTFYGGGEWVVLNGFLGWVYACQGRSVEARRCLAWMGEQANAAGHLPEQVSTNVNDRTMVSVWVERWGPIAQPLLWSHAMYLILADALEVTARDRLPPAAR